MANVPSYAAEEISRLLKNSHLHGFLRDWRRVNITLFDRRRGIGNLAAFADDCAGGHPVRLEIFGFDDMRHVHSLSHKKITQEASVAFPEKPFGAHNGRRTTCGK